MNSEEALQQQSRRRVVDPVACTHHENMESSAPTRMSRQLTGGNVQEDGALLGAGAPAGGAARSDSSNSGDAREEKAVNLCMIGTGEYTTGYVHGGASDSDKGAGGGCKAGEMFVSRLWRSDWYRKLLLSAAAVLQHSTRSRLGNNNQHRIGQIASLLAGATCSGPLRYICTFQVAWLVCFVAS